VNVQVSGPVELPVAESNPQSLTFAAVRLFATVSRIAQTESGVPQLPVRDKSRVVWLAPVRAASSAALWIFCFKLKAAPKSKMPTTSTTRRGSDTANSTI
jgi:hypothetical protein